MRQIPKKRKGKKNLEIKTTKSNSTLRSNTTHPVHVHSPRNTRDPTQLSLNPRNRSTPLALIFKRVDPWEGNSLEWATTSPPPAWNFDSLPPIRSERPVFDARMARADAPAVPEGST